MTGEGKIMQFCLAGAGGGDENGHFMSGGLKNANVKQLMLKSF